MSQYIKEAQESALNLCQATPLVIFRPEEPAFSPIVLTKGSKCPALLTRANTFHAAQALTETAAPNTTTPEAVGNGERNSNCARPTDGQILSPSMSAALTVRSYRRPFFGGTDGNSDYVELSKNSTTSSANTSDLEGHISKLEIMHEVLEGDIDAIFRPMSLFSHTDKLEITSLTSAETDLPEKL